MHLKAYIFGKNETKEKKKKTFFLIYFDLQANIRIYSNNNNRTKKASVMVWFIKL